MKKRGKKTDKKYMRNDTIYGKENGKRKAKKQNGTTKKKENEE